MKPFMHTLYTFLFLVVLSSCNALRPETDLVKLDGQRWKLSSIGHKNVDSDKAYLEFDGKDLEVSGKTFCNSIKGDYERMGDNQLTFQELVSTKMYCEGVMDLENQMVISLRSVKRFEIRNSMLYLYDSDKVLLTFKK